MRENGGASSLIHRLATTILLSGGLMLPTRAVAACGLVAVFPLLYWISAQPAFRVTEGRATE